jgi:hypothetical protein
MERQAGETERQIAIYRTMTPAQRVRAACGLHDFVHNRLTADLARRLPNKTHQEILTLAARRLLGDAAGVF